ncbi:MAG TPA: helix-turn-helix transcriptional regulator [Terracidiphilus sp.]
MPEVRSPTVRRRELGGILRSLRLARGMTVEQVAEQLLCSPSKVSRMETGSRAATLRDVRDLCDLYEVKDPAERERLSKLATEGKQQGWWQPYELDTFATYVGLEAEATTLIDFRCTTVPGLLQTADYARTMHRTAVPGFTPERIEEFVEVRLTRQRLLLQRDSPLQLIVVIDEAMLHRVVGGPAVMAEQLDWLVESARQPSVTIRVIPLEFGAHPAMDSNFNILEFDTAPSVVYVEGLVGWIYMERPQDLARYEEVFESLLSASLSPRESIELMSAVGAQYKERTAELLFPYR